jgi:hypothetical protein
MAYDTNLIWKNGEQYNKIMSIIQMSEIFESNDITSNEFIDRILKEPDRHPEYYEHLFIDSNSRIIEMDGEALRFDWFSIKTKLLKLRENGWKITQLDPDILEQYPWLKEQIKEKSLGKGWHGHRKEHSVKRTIGHLKKKSKEAEEKEW